ncbi:sugar ABC transporter substrate-binding protein, partial [Microbispora tritici]
MSKNVGRRGFLVSGAVLGAGALVTACTSNEPAAQASAPAAAPAAVASGGNDAPGDKVVIGFSAPA